MTIKPIGQYLKDISRYSLLTPAEERELMMLVIRGRTTRSKNVKQKARAARQRLIECNQALVVFIAKKYVRHHLSLDLLDLIQEGNTGLMHAIDHKFEYGRGSNKLSNYVTQWIRQRIGDYIKEKTRIVHIPYCFASLIDQYNQTLAEISHRTGQLRPDRKTVAQFMGRKERSIVNLEKATRQCISLDALTKNDRGSLKCQDNNGDPETEAADRKKIRRLIIKHLKPREAFVILARFGINCSDALLIKMAERAERSDPNYFVEKWQKIGQINRPRSEGRTLTEIGDALKVTRERVRQIEVKAKKKLAQRLKAFDPKTN